MAELEIRLLGSPQFLRDNHPLTSITSHKSLALLIYLAVTRQAHTRDKLAALLWGEMSDADARNNLRQALTTLRKITKDELTITRDTVEFSGNCLTDSARFEWNVNTAGTLDAEQAIDRLAEAMTLYRGDFMEGFFIREAPDFEDWMLAERARLRELALQSLNTLTHFHTKRGNFNEAMIYAVRLLAFDPWREEAHRQLMLLQARTGQYSAALSQYQACKKILEKELGVQPAYETTLLYDKIRAARQTARHNLPAPSTEFMGREMELANLRQLLADPRCRLVTLTGLGGCGKTRLAQEAVRQCADLFINGAWFVPLAALQENPTKRTFYYAIASSLPFKLSGSEDPQEQLVKFFRSRELLLVLENLEHLLDFGDIIANLLRLAPDLKIMVTSRERLNLQIEWVVDISGFPPEIAVPFFVQRARRVKATFTPTSQDEAIIYRINQMVDGLPLGLELAAAWARTMDCAAIADEIARSLDFLVTTQQDIPQRQRSLGAVFESSWERLSEQERSAFTCLSVFRGGFTRQAVEAVAKCSLHLLNAIVDRSLVQRHSDGRYAVHEVLRQYAEEKLHASWKDFEDIRDRHSQYYTDWLADLGSYMGDAREKEALQQISEDVDNVRKAWHRAVETKNGAALSNAVQPLYNYYRIRGYFREGLDTFQSAIASLSELNTGGYHDLIVGRLMARLGKFQILLGDYPASLTPLKKSLLLFRQCGAESDSAFSIRQLGTAAWLMGDFQQARDLLAEAVEIQRRLGDRSGLADSFLGLSGALYMLEEWSAMAEVSQSGLLLAEELGNRILVAHFGTSLANVAYMHGEYAASIDMLRKSLLIYRENKDMENLGLALHLLARATLASGEAEAAEKLSRESLSIRREIGNKGGMVEALTLLAWILCMEGRAGEAEALDREALALALDINSDPVYAYVFTGLAGLLLNEGKLQRAAEMLAYANQYSGFPDVRILAAQLSSTLEAKLTPRAWLEAQENGGRLQLEMIIERWLG